MAASSKDTFKAGRIRYEWQGKAGGRKIRGLFFPGTAVTKKFKKKHKPGKTLRKAKLPDDTIVCLHGWLDNAASFIPLAELLPGYSLLALDMPGHGRSDHNPPGQLYHFMDYPTAILQVIEKYTPKLNTIIGHSLGAGVACFVASVLGERIDKLVMLDGLGPLSNAEDKAVSKYKVFYDFYVNPQTSKFDPKNNQSLSLERMVKVRQKVGGLAEHSARLLVKRNSKKLPKNGAYTWRYDQALKVPSPFRLTEGQVLNFMAGISASSLLFKTSELPDAFIPVVNKRVEAMQKLTIVEEAGGHHLHCDDPARIAPKLIEFLAKD